MFAAIADGFSYLFGWVGDLFGWILDGIMSIIQPIIDLITGIFYLIYKIGVILFMVIELVFSVGRLLIGLLTGLVSTFLGLNYTGKSADIPDAYQDVFNRLAPVFEMLQIDNIATILNWTLWIVTAFTAIRIIGAMRGGNGE